MQGNFFEEGGHDYGTKKAILEQLEIQKLSKFWGGHDNGGDATMGFTLIKKDNKIIENIVDKNEIKINDNLNNVNENNQCSKMKYGRRKRKENQKRKRTYKQTLCE